MNPVACQILSTALEPRPERTFCSGNAANSLTPTAPLNSQPVHSDRTPNSFVRICVQRAPYYDDT
ncbi:hypothetical protein BDV10DRAFT_100795 [Aspergillus recurvatus]